MRVAELAAELDLPTSTLLEHCQELGIAEPSPDTELADAEVGALRARLASNGTTEPADGPTEPAAAPPGPAGPGGSRSGRGLRSDRRVQLEEASRRSVIAVVVAIVALVVAEVVNRDWVIAILWLVAGIAVVVSIWSGIRGLQRVRRYPDRLTGAGLAVGAIGVSVVVGLVLAISLAAVVGSAPAADAPLGLGDRSSVATARWSYKQVRLAAAHDWKTSGKVEATCWTTDAKGVRDADRVEVGPDEQDCEGEHNVQIIELYRYDTDADSPFPGVAAIQEDAAARCRVLAAKLLNPEGEPPITGVLIAEHPNEAGWAKGDRDITCAVVTDARRGRLR